jgi:ABC-type antimicrobial peptide transport system permease subunit
MLKKAIILSILLLNLSCFVYGYSSDTVSKDDLIETVTYLSKIKSRVVGYPGIKTAENYVYNKLKSLGLKDLRKEEFNVVSPIEEYAYMILPDGGRVTLRCLWPNHLRTSTVDIDKARLVYGADGEWKNLNDKQIEGNIVLLDFNCGIKWLNIAKLGARAIVFMEPEDTSRREAELKFLRIPLNIPRFWISKDNARILETARKGITVKLKARMVWKEVKATNILGYIRGTDSKLKEEVIVIESYYDSMSVVPALSPGAETSCGIATLLELAKYFSHNPPKRTLLFLATSGHSIKLAGINDFLYNHIEGAGAKQKMKDPIKNINIFLGLDLTSQNDSIGIFGSFAENPTQGWSYRQSVKLRLSAFAERLTNITKKAKLPEDLRPDMLIHAVKALKGKPPRSFLPCKSPLDSQAVIRRGLSALGLATTADGRLLVDTPLDRAEKVNFDNIFLQTRLLVEVLSLSLNNESFTEKPGIEYPDSGTLLELRLVSFDPKKGYEPNDSRAGAFAHVQTGENVETTNAGVRNLRFYKTNEQGTVYIANETALEMETLSHGFEVDDGTGEITYAPDRGVYGDEQFPMLVIFTGRKMKQKITLFSCESVDIYDFFDPQYLVRLTKLDILGKDNAIPPSYGYLDLGKAGTAKNIHLWSSFNEPYAVAFMEKDKDIKVILSSDAFGKRCLFINSESGKTKDIAEGKGFAVNTTNALYYPTMQAAKDMFNLDEYRINTLRARGIKEKFLEDTHNETAGLIDKAEKAKRKFKWDEYARYSQQALGIESRLYPDIKSTLNDVVRGVIFYMIILLPFAFFMERLVFSFVSTTKRIMGVSGIFLLIYIIMRTVHPAFKLAIAPEIILLSFVVLVLATIVFVLIQGKFEEQIGKIKKGETKGLYVTDVGRISAMGVAFSLGISNMKKYRMRTFLTSATVVLLTFTVLSFTSIQTRMSYTRMKQTRMKAPYNGFLLRDPRGWPLELASLGYIKNEYSNYSDVSVCPRAEFNFGYAGAASPSDASVYITLKSKQGRETNVCGALGVTPKETSVTKFPVRGSWFKKGELYSCVLPEEVTKRLKVKIGDTVRMFGKDLTLIGILDTKKFRKLKDLDSGSISPMDLSGVPPQVMKDMKISRQAGLQSTPLVSTLPRVDASDFIIVPYRFLMRTGGILTSIAVKFSDRSKLEKNIGSLMKKLSTTLYVGLGDDIYTYNSLKTTKVGGLAILFIPIFIAGLIILNTMLGSVYERINDIGIYSSVGLAPSHISMLFFGESCVYSVLGSVLGYLLGQVVVKLFAAFNILAGLNLNYSSLSTVFVTLLVICIVFLSTLYPAKKAADLSVPDVTRRWNIPKPAGDDLNFQFPFTVSGLEVLGLFSFMKSFFESYTEASVGNFYTADTRLKKTEAGYLVENAVWLAPYALGVKQHFILEARRTKDVEEIYEIAVRIKRIEGDVSTWTRLNRQFLNILRKEFLVWRTIEVATKEEYRKEGELIIVGA